MNTSLPPRRTDSLLQFWLKFDQYRKVKSEYITALTPLLPKANASKRHRRYMDRNTKGDRVRVKYSVSVFHSTLDDMDTILNLIVSLVRLRSVLFSDVKDEKIRVEYWLTAQVLTITTSFPISRSPGSMRVSLKHAPVDQAVSPAIMSAQRFEWIETGKNNKSRGMTTDYETVREMIRALLK